MSRRLRPQRSIVTGLAAALLALPLLRSQSPGSASDAGGTAAGTGASIDEVLDLQYGTASRDPKRNRLDLYLPRTAAPRPVVVFVHGGSWTTGSKDQHAFVGRFLAENGFAAAVVDYRLFPFDRWPAFAEDCAAACAFVAAHAAEYDFDIDRVFLVGHSAGAQIAGVVAFDPQWLRAAGAPALRVRGFVGLSGPYDLRPKLPQLLKIFGEPLAARAGASPVACVQAGAPPSLLLTAEHDIPNLELSARMLAAKLRMVGAAVERGVQPGNHVGYVFALGKQNDHLGPVLLEFLRAHGDRADGRTAVADGTARAPQVRHTVIDDVPGAATTELYVPTGPAQAAPAPLLVFACRDMDRAALGGAADHWARQGVAVAVARVDGTTAEAAARLAVTCSWLEAHAAELSCGHRLTLAGCGTAAEVALLLGTDPELRQTFAAGELADIAALFPPAPPAELTNAANLTVLVIDDAEATGVGAARPGRISLPAGAFIPVPVPFSDAASMLRSVGSSDDALTELLVGLAGA